MNTTELKLIGTKLASNKEYRDAFVASFFKRYIPFQIRTIRKKRKMSQPEVAEAAHITQGVVSRAEDSDYGNLTFNTVLRIASGYDLPFVGRFVRWEEFLKIVNEMSEEDFDLPSFDEECEMQVKVAALKDEQASEEQPAQEEIPPAIEEPVATALHDSFFLHGNTNSNTAIQMGTSPTGNAGDGAVLRMPPKRESALATQYASL